MNADRFKYSNYSGTEGQRHSGTKIFARPANLYMFLLCPEKPGPLGQVRDRWLCLGVLCLKKERRTSNVESRYAFGVSILMNLPAASRRGIMMDFHFTFRSKRRGI